MLPADDGLLEPLVPLPGDEPVAVEPPLPCGTDPEGDPVPDAVVAGLDTAETVAASALLATLAK